MTPLRRILEETNATVTIIPFYGGGKGQALQIVQNPNGTVSTMIIKKPPLSTTTPTIDEVENPPLPPKGDNDYTTNIQNIHKTALNVIKLQENAKKNGKWTEAEEEEYKENMESLNSSAKNLAQIQEGAGTNEFDFENREGLSEWFDRKQTLKKEKENKKNPDRKREEEEKRKEEVEEEERKKQEENKTEKPKEQEQEEEEIEENEDTDGVSIGLPPEDASVAEAKPVGLAVAGEGGVAASKPIATAVVGPGGLAIARPVGTAIAGVAPDQALVPIYAEGYIVGTKPKRNGSGNKAKSDSASEFLNRIISKYHQN